MERNINVCWKCGYMHITKGHKMDKCPICGEESSEHTKWYEVYTIIAVEEELH